MKIHHQALLFVSKPDFVWHLIIIQPIRSRHAAARQHVIPDRRVAGRVPFPADRERRVVPTVVIHGVWPAIMGPAVLLLTEDGRVGVCVR